MTTLVKIDPVQLGLLFRGKSGPVMMHVAVVAGRVQKGAKERVGVSEDPEGGGPHPHLRDTIVKRFVETAGGPAVRVGSEQAHALLHHEGTKPHVIEPKNAKVLRFTIGGTVFFATRVNHPGTKPNRYLTDAAEAEGLIVRRTV